jgi:hypothetical protein
LESRYDCFLLYRTNDDHDTDVDAVEKLYLHLKVMGLNPFWVKRRRNADTDDYIMSEIKRGLLNSKVVIPILSEVGLRQCKALNRNHSLDLLLIGLELALKIANLRNDVFFSPPLICPVKECYTHLSL